MKEAQFWGRETPPKRDLPAFWSVRTHGQPFNDERLFNGAANVYQVRAGFTEQACMCAHAHMRRQTHPQTLTCAPYSTGSSGSPAESGVARSPPAGCSAHGNPRSRCVAEQPAWQLAG